MLSQERHTARAVRAVAGAVFCVRDEPGAAVLVWGHDPDHDPDSDTDRDTDRRFCFNPRIVGLLHDPERVNAGERRSLPPAD